MCSLILRSSSAAHSVRCISVGIFRSPSFVGARMMSSGVSDKSPMRISSSPWMTQPPAFEGGDMVYKFYKLAEKKVENFKVGGLELPDDINGVRIVGSSHGWLALFIRSNNQMFLSNPITRQLIILSDGLGAYPRLAFCWPGHSTEWTPIGDMFLHDRLFPEKYKGWPRVYEDLAYCSRLKRFCSSETEDWDLSDSDVSGFCYFRGEMMNVTISEFPAMTARIGSG